MRSGQNGEVVIIIVVVDDDDENDDDDDDDADFGCCCMCRCVYPSLSPWSKLSIPTSLPPLFYLPHPPFPFIFFLTPFSGGPFKKMQLWILTVL